MFTVISIVFMVFVSRLVDWQIVNAEYYKLRANSSNIYFVTTDPVRGEILDCDSVGLAVNDTGYKAVIDRLLVPKEKENEFILKSVKFLESLKCNWIDLLPIKLENKNFRFEEGKDQQSKSLKKTLKLPEDASADDCMKAMIKKYKVESFSKSDQRIICSIRLNMEKNSRHYSKGTPYVLSDSISKEAVLIISEKSEEFKGLRVQTSLLRKYINGEIAPHIVGYTGFMSSEEYEKLKNEINDIKNKCKFIDSDFKNKYKTEYDDLQKHFKTLVKKPSMQEVLYDVELVIHVKTDDETSNDILENIQNFVSLGRSEDFIELIEAKETEVFEADDDVNLKDDYKIYAKLSEISRDGNYGNFIFTDGNNKKEAKGTVYYISKDYVIEDNRRIFNRIACLYSSNLGIDEDSNGVVDNDGYIVSFN